MGDLVYDLSPGNNKFLWKVTAKHESTHEMVELSGLNGAPKVEVGMISMSKLNKLLGGLPIRG